VLPLVIVQYRDRRTGMRRTYQIAEIMPEEHRVWMNTVYQWNPKNDQLEKVGEHVRLFNELTMHTGVSMHDIKINMEEKKRVLEWMGNHQVRDILRVGRVVAHYYRDPKHVLEIVDQNAEPEALGLGKS